MEMPDLKQLGKVIDLCRKKGVDTITIGTLTLKLGAEPLRVTRAGDSGQSGAETDPADPYQNFPGGILTPEQLMFYSAGGVPGQEPWNQSPRPDGEQ